MRPMQKYSAAEGHCGTRVEIAASPDSPAARAAVAEAFSLFAETEREFSRFLPDSALSRLNREKRLAASPRFRGLLALSRGLHAATRGAFNPLVRVARLGYSASLGGAGFGAEERGAEPDLDLAGVREKNGEIYLRESQALDFGGIAKEDAADRAAALLSARGIAHFFVNAGGDIVARGNNPSGLPWGAAVENPLGEGWLGTVRVRDAAVATSGSYRRKWARPDGSPAHHLVDPSTGGNRFGTVSATVLADSCARAGAFAKAACLLEPGAALAALARDGLRGLLVTAGGSAALIGLEPRPDGELAPSDDPLRIVTCPVSDLLRAFSQAR